MPPAAYGGRRGKGQAFPTRATRTCAFWLYNRNTLNQSKMTEVDYLSARIYALASQLHFFAGQTHPYYDYACKEFYYIVNEIARCRTTCIGVKIARAIQRVLDSETEETRASKTFVAHVSPKQSYRMAEAAIKYEIELKTAIQINNENHAED